MWLSVATLITLFFLTWKIPSDPDLFWHIRAGQDILKDGIPRIDWYTFTAPNFQWVNHEFAQDVVISWVHGLGGLRLVALFFSLIIAATLTVALRWSQPRQLPWTLSLLSGLAIIGLSGSFIGARPQMFSYLFVLLLLGLLYKSRRQTWLTWLIPVLLLVWANWHASFALGIVTILVFVGSEILTFLIPGNVLGKARAKKQLLALSAVIPLSIGATFINPYGRGIWVETLRTLTDSELYKNIVEWFPSILQKTNGKIFFGVAILAIFALVYKKTRPGLSTAAVLLVFFLAGASGVRNIPLFLLVAIPLIAATTYEWWPNLITKISSWWPVLLVFSVAALLWIDATVPINKVWRINPTAQAYRDASYPVDAASFLVEHSDQYQGARTFHSYAWGGYLLYRIPWFETFIDGRMPSWEYEGQKLIDQYFTIDRVDDDWREVFSKYAIDTVVVQTDHPLIPELQNDPKFSERYSDEQTIIFSSR